MNPALVVFAKVPAAGAVKTRLSPPLSPNDAARLYEAFLLDALDEWTRVGAFDLPVSPAIRLYLAPEGPPAPADFGPAGVSMHVQQGDGLGARMLRAFVESFAAGHDVVVIVGSDHPTLPTEFVAEAFRALEERYSVVLGPSDDGGYYLVGSNEVFPGLFEGLEYSHGGVLTEAIDRTIGAGANLALLPPWYDVDTPEGLARLAREHAAGARVGQRTAAVLEGLAEDGMPPTP